ncbi:histone-lysine N-methyltransferase EHMT2 isoform X2 [Bacillus rossius redtenbacheri]|uniref:histone-lysine N-methyltransferase EHMT2 isoform X2 n=1 Tax=Bacillus rossius redtenbacheri TaxID=93214 RepID=UPI002FDCC231
MTENASSKLECNESISKPLEDHDVNDHRVFIETILVEMKSEFNRNLGMEEKELPEVGNKCSALKCEKESVKNEVSEVKSERKAKLEKKSKESQENECEVHEATLKENAVMSEDNKEKIEIPSICIETKLEAEDIEKLETSKNSLENEKSREIQNSEEVMKIPSRKKGKTKDVEPTSTKLPSARPNENGDDALPVQKVTPKGKRSLRSQTLVKTPPSTEEPLGVKRSARRRSKDCPRESVLQSAIARKEKSFSNFSHSEEKSVSRNFRSRLNRSPRINSGERVQPPNRGSGTSHTKSSLESVPKSSTSKTSKVPILNSADGGKANPEPDVVDQSETQVEILSLVKSTDISVKNNSDSCSKSPLQVVAAAGQSYTKTGKRRYKPYRGLRYSFTTGPVKKTKLTKRQLKNGVDNVDGPSSVRSGLETTTALPEKLEDGEQSAADCCPVGQEVVLTVGAGQKVLQTDERDSVKEVIVERTNTCKAAPLKRTALSGDSASVDSKLMRLNLSPSPIPADVPQPEVEPDAGNIPSGARTAALCLCQAESRVYVTVEESDSDLYCQAVDSVDGHSIGCYNAIRMGEACMLRASTALQYQLLCAVHRQRLLRHGCCAGCGMFCTQGRFVMCSSQHLYHRSCSRMIDQVAVCPHCGVETPAVTDFLVTMQAAKNPVFLPQQKSAVKYPHAKISFGGSFPVKLAPDPDRWNPIPPPLVPADLLSIPARTEMPLALDRDKYNVKSLYQAAKTGNAEKLINILGAGVNPNHVFRECATGTALHLACCGGHLGAAHVLVQAGAQLDLLDQDQNTALMLAVLEGRLPVVRYLLKAGASVLHKGADGMTALHLAAKGGHLEECKLLLMVSNLPRGYVNSLDEGRWTPLVWAAEHSHEDIVRFLLEKRADPLIRDAEQNIALHWSAFSGSVDITEMLLNHGADVNVVNAHGDTPLHIGARQNMYDCVVLLLARGARTDIRNKTGKTALDCCFSPAEDTHKAISLNVMLQSIVRTYSKQVTRVLCNDISGGKEMNPIQCVNWEDDALRPTDFLYVKENCFTSSIDVDRTITSLHSCLCVDSCTSELCMCARFSMGVWYDDDSRLLPGFNYADPPMLFECNQRCSCNQILCKNRVMQNGMTVRLQLFRTPHKGWGVRTLRPIPKGSYVCEYVGEIISDSEADHREDDSYLFDLENKDGETYCIDARDYGNITRFINHMCLPNLTSVRVFVEHQDLHFPRIALFANRDIEANEELGYDYGEKFWIIKCKSFTCMCGDESCRYSEATIQQTLDDYKRRVHETETPAETIS